MSNVKPKKVGSKTGRSGGARATILQLLMYSVWWWFVVGVGIFGWIVLKGYGSPEPCYGDDFDGMVLFLPIALLLGLVLLGLVIEGVYGKYVPEEADTNHKVIDAAFMAVFTLSAAGTVLFTVITVLSELSLNSAGGLDRADEALGYIWLGIALAVLFGALVLRILLGVRMRLVWMVVLASTFLVMAFVAITTIQTRSENDGIDCRLYDPLPENWSY